MRSVVKERSRARRRSWSSGNRTGRSVTIVPPLATGLEQAEAQNSAYTGKFLGGSRLSSLPPWQVGEAGGKARYHHAAVLSRALAHATRYHELNRIGLQPA